MQPIRVFVADDHTLFRDGLRALFGSLPDFDMVGEAADGRQAIEQIDEIGPDVVLMDIQMPGINGIEATRRITGSNPHIGVIVVTMLEDDDSVFSAMRAGARGYVVKGAGQEDMLRAVRAAARGEALFGPGIAERMMRFFSKPRPAVPEQPFPELTGRELEVLELIAQGKDNAGIGRALSISPKTVANHCSSIFAKLQVADRTQALLRAREAGLGKDGNVQS